MTALTGVGVAGTRVLVGGSGVGWLALLVAFKSSVGGNIVAVGGAGDGSEAAAAGVGKGSSLPPQEERMSPVSMSKMKRIDGCMCMF